MWLCQGFIRDDDASMAWRGRQTPSTRVPESQPTQDGFSTSIELTLALAQTTRNGVPAGNREHTLRGSVASGTMTGTVETTMFGSVARGDLELTKM